jgi:hypothetical protein
MGENWKFGQVPPISIFTMIFKTFLKVEECTSFVVT